MTKLCMGLTKLEFKSGFKHVSSTEIKVLENVVHCCCCGKLSIVVVCDIVGQLRVEM